MRGMAEPLMEIVVDNKPLRALVDTGATYSTVTRGTITDKDLSDKTSGSHGFLWWVRTLANDKTINRPGCESELTTLIPVHL